MGKGNSQKGNKLKPVKANTGSSKGGGSSGAWSFEHHSTRVLNKIDRDSKREIKKDQTNEQNSIAQVPLSKKKQKKINHRHKIERQFGENHYKRSFLAHDGKNQIEAKKISLHITKLKREIEQLRKRLKSWDDVTEAKIERERIAKEELERKRKLEEEENFGKPKKRKRRPGPETWKLRGAARPAYEVYDFDTRYVDPYMKEHEEAKARANRSRNIFALFKGQFGISSDEKNGPPQPACRNFLSMLVQLAHLSEEARKFKTAREAFLECIDLEGDNNGEPSITNARSHLMRMYMEANRPESARRLWERFPTDSSAWVRYSAALVEFVSWKLLNEEGSTEQSSERLLAHAVQSNVYCAFYLAFHDTFQSVFEYTEDIEDAHERTLEEAIEYCSSEQMGAWLGTEGALEWIKNNLLDILQNGKSKYGFINRTHLDWNHSLLDAEIQYKEKKRMEDERIHLDNVDNKGNTEEDQEEEETDGADFIMYSGMFRTAFEMLDESGAFQDSKTYDSDSNS